MLKRLLILILGLLVLTSFTGCDIGRKRSVMITYVVNILPKEGENPKNVTVYLPFPYHKGKPIKKVFKAMKHRFEKFVKDDHPDATLKLVSIKQGKMIKVNIPDELGIGVSFSADPHDPKYGPAFIEPISLPPASTLYKLKPRFQIEKVEVEPGKFDQISHTRAYVNYENATGLVLRILYSVKDRSPAPFPFIWGHPAGGDFFAFIGLDRLPDWRKQPFTRPVPVEVNNKGWIKLSVAEAGYGSR